jgi:gamma-butyrobetaine dioxygenase
MAATVELLGSRYHALWLRDNCPCPECRHPNGQRLLDTRLLPVELAVTGVDGLRITFSDGHSSSFDPQWLRAERAEPIRPSRRLWDASLEDALPRFRFADVAAGGRALRDWLAAVDELGFGVLVDGPTEPGTVTHAAELFGFVRETNYGRLFDVRTVVEPSNLAYTGLALGAHTDNPYRDPTPTLQLLHCLATSAEGGENTLVDGFRVVQELELEERRLLGAVAVRFRYADVETELEAEWPVVSFDARGEPVAIHYNTRSAQPFRLDPDLVEPYYAAYRRFGELLESPDLRIRIRLAPGDLFIVDNLRVLHGRTAYASSGGERHLQGCYADRDGLRSRLAVLRR